jgi:hypothetical protein
MSALRGSDRAPENVSFNLSMVAFCHARQDILAATAHVDKNATVPAKTHDIGQVDYWIPNILG